MPAQETFPFRCPHCQMLYSGTADRRGERFDCSKCGKVVTIPDRAWDERDEPGEAPSWSVSSPAEAPPSIPRDEPRPASRRESPREEEVVPAGDTIVVRCCIDGQEVRKFRTDLPPAKFLRDLDDILDQFRLSREDDGHVGGTLRYSWEMLYNMTVDGVARMSESKPEFRIDLTPSHSMAALAIVLCIFLFPWGLIGLLILGNNIGPEGRRTLENLYRELKTTTAVRDDR